MASSDNGPEFKKLGMVGAGSMGGMMSLLFAEYGVDVHFLDPSEENVKQLLEMAKSLKTDRKIVQETDYEQLCESIQVEGQPRLFVFSIPHGTVGDKTVDSLLPYLIKGDVILDCSNELWTNTERRQAKLDPKGIHYVGCGVSGGYQSARHGPSMSPGGTKEALDAVMPFLRRVAAKDKQGRPCTTPIGPGGSGHYVKMVHNGIEQGMMSALAEIWSLMTTGLGMSYEEVADVFDEWTKTDPLRDNFLVSIGVDINRTKDDQGDYLVSKIRDKVVRACHKATLSPPLHPITDDFPNSPSLSPFPLLTFPEDVNNEEGTGTWTSSQAIDLHIPAPTIIAAHLFRLGSADASQRAAVHDTLTKNNSQGLPSPTRLQINDRAAVLHDLQQALYATFLCAFIQGLHTIHAAALTHGWALDYAAILAIWRGGCIIQSDYITDLLTSVFESFPHPFSASSAPTDPTSTRTPSLLTSPLVASPLTDAFPSLKTTVLRATEADHPVPALSATLEYLKYSSRKEGLPTGFMEAQLDFFGRHMFELVEDEMEDGVQKGGRHWEWRPARGIMEG